MRYLSSAAAQAGFSAEQRVAVVVEVADQGDDRAHLRETVADVRHGLGGLVAVDSDAHDLGAGAGKLGRLPRGPLYVGRVGVGHRLHDDGRISADRDAADIDGNGDSAGEEMAGHGFEF